MHVVPAEPMLVGAAAELKDSPPAAGAGCSEATARATPASSSRSTPRSPTTCRSPSPPTRSTPRPPATHPRLPGATGGCAAVFLAAIVVGLVWIGVASAWSWSQQQYYVGEQDGEVVIFRGVDASLPGLDLDEPVVVSDMRLDDFAPIDRRGDRGRHRGRRPRRRPREGRGARRGPSDARRAADDPTEIAATNPATNRPTRPPSPPRPRRARRQRADGRSHRVRAHGLRAPPPPGRRAVPARARSRRRRGRLRRGRPRRRGRGAAPTSSATGAGWPRCMVAAHVVVRLVAPYADPVLLPVVAALNGLGLAVIHRIDLAGGHTPSPVSS